MPPEEPSPSVPPVSAPRAGWLLVLGRQANVRTLLVTFLTQAGYPVVGCATFAEAEAAFTRQGAPALLLYDGEALSETALHERLQQLARLLPSASTYPVLLFSLAHPLPRSEQLPGSVTVVAQPFDLSQVLQLATTSTFPQPHDGC
jgi:CheY-like chemotaxis protein